MQMKFDFIKKNRFFAFVSVLALVVVVFASYYYNNVPPTPGCLVLFSLLFFISLGTGIVFYAQRDEYRQLFFFRQILKAILHSTCGGIITTDAGGRVQNMSRAAQKFTGWGEAAAKNQPVNDIFKIVVKDSFEMT